MTEPMAIMCAGFTTNNVALDEFHDWYDLEHIPERLGVQGFINAERWIGSDDPNIAFATYDLDTVAVLQSPPYRAFTGANQSPWTRRIESRLGKIGRFVGEQIFPGRVAGPPNAGGLLFGAMNVAAEAEDEFNEWYNTEHMPRLLGVAGCLAARRFRAEGGSHRYLSVYHLSSPAVCASRSWQDAVTTPWAARITPRTSDRLRIPMRRYLRGA